MIWPPAKNKKNELKLIQVLKKHQNTVIVSENMGAIAFPDFKFYKVDVVQKLNNILYWNIQRLTHQ